MRVWEREAGFPRPGETCAPQVPATLCLPEPWPLGTLPGSQVTDQDLLHHAGDADACELHITHVPGCAYTCTHHTHTL